MPAWIGAKQIEQIAQMLESENLEQRVTAIETLGGIGDADVLRRLRERWVLTGKEHYALIVAVGKSKKRPGVK
jgi:hypothetical protein